MKPKVKVFVCILISILMSLLCSQSYAVTDEKGKEITIDDIYEYKENDRGNITITGITDLFPLYYEQNKSVLELPSTLNGKTVDMVLFSLKSAGNFKRIVLPADMKSIASNVFANCTELESVTIPSGVTVIGANAFSRCEKLKKIELPEGITTIKEFAFAGCTGLEEIKNLDKVRNIEFGVFQNCSKLKAIELSDKITVIEDSAFEGCSSLEEVELSKNVQTIKPFAFNNCDGLKKVTIYNSKAVIAHGAFEKTNNLTIYGYKVSTAKTYATNNNIKFVALPETMTSVEKAGILMSSFASRCADTYAGRISYSWSNREIHVFNTPASAGAITSTNFDCVGYLNLFIYQSTGLWSKNFTSYNSALVPPLNDNYYLGPIDSNGKLVASDLFEYKFLNGKNTGMTFSELKYYAENGDLKPGDLLTMCNHVAMFCRYDSSWNHGMRIPETFTWSRFGSGAIGWSGQTLFVVRIKEEAADAIPGLAELSTKEEIEAYGIALADAYFNGSTVYNGQTLYRKVYYQTHIMVGDNATQDLTFKNKTVKANDGTYKSLKLTGKCKDMTVKQMKAKLIAAKGYTRVDILDKDGNVILDENTKITTGMKARGYIAKTSPEVGSSPIAFEVGEEGTEDEEVEEYSTVVYGDVTGKGEPGAIDALAIVKNNTGKIPLEDEVYVEAGRVTKKSRENDLIPSSVDAYYISSSKLGRCEIEQGDFEDIEIIESDGDVIPLYTREDLENVGSGEEYVSKTTHEAYVMDTDAKYVLMADIDLSDGEWIPLGREAKDEKESTILTNEFNGNGHAIKNMTINCDEILSEDDSVIPVGLFSICKAKVYDLNFENAQIEYKNDSKNIGILAGKYIVNDETEDNVMNNVNIKSTSIIDLLQEQEANLKTENIGGLVGKIEYEDECDKVISIENCQNDGVINGNGGIVGTSNVRLKLINCKNLNSVHSDIGVVGGLIGFVDSNTAIVIECENSGIIEGKKTYSDASTGGIIGKITNSKLDVRISSCINNASINGYNHIGGMVGFIESKDVLDDKNIRILSNENNGNVEGNTDISGILGYFENKNAEKTTLTVMKCKNSADEIKGAFATGGIIGGINSGTFNQINILDNENFGNIVGNGDVGGIVGGTWFINSVNLSDCKNSGKIKSLNNGEVGGIIGFLDLRNHTEKSQVVNCYNSGDIEVDGGALVGGIAGEVYKNFDLKILGCVNDGNVKANDEIGGIIGCLSNHDDGTTLINGCKNNGNLLANNNYVGGIIAYISFGSKTEIINNTNTGKLSSPSNFPWVGGITAYITSDYATLTLENNSSSGILDIPNNNGCNELDPLYGNIKN